MTITLNIDIPKRLSKISHDELQKSLSWLLQDYTEFDLHLLQKHMQIRDLPESRFVNL